MSDLLAVLQALLLLVPIAWHGWCSEAPGYVATWSITYLSCSVLLTFRAVNSPQLTSTTRATLIPSFTLSSRWCWNAVKTRACTMPPSMKNTRTNDSDLRLSSSRQKLNTFAFPKSPKRTASPTAMDFLKPHTIGSVCNMHTSVLMLFVFLYILIPPFFAEHVLLIPMSLAFPAFSSRLPRCPLV